MALLSLPFPWPPLPARASRTELRIDVARPTQPVADALENLHARLHTPGDSLQGIPSIGLGDPDLVVRYREADGEFYLYVEDLRHRRLAGYTVFNRLVELDRRADRHLRAPHSNYAAPYQRRGLASALYRWGLGAGLCLITGARQSPGAHALWRALARDHELGCVRLADRRLTYLGTEVPPAVLEDLHTRMFLLGRGWTLARFAHETGMRL
ncbi:N-acetyltransferase [Hydrogenophaga sp.]|uniref:N-acetyltransferase n=1 Tax=Hydrogenophaga sp. TaxID=1904254 RepID=UPI00262AA403|nr:N-acetyltransferase [Hydrogenophaga sp.]MCW5655822.1 N-acetyltransferase [Hydrogenophaga sp.]